MSIESDVQRLIREQFIKDMEAQHAADMKNHDSFLKQPMLAEMHDLVQVLRDSDRKTRYAFAVELAALAMRMINDETFTEYLERAS